MNKKGMTLVELITVLVVIGMIAVITIPTIIKTINKSKEQTTDIQEASIKEAANSYVSKNVGLNIFIDDSTITEEITLETLVNEGYLKGELKNLKTNKEYDLEKSIVIVSKNSVNKSYNYKLKLYDVTP